MQNLDLPEGTVFLARLANLRCPVDGRELFPVQLVIKSRGLVVSEFPGQSDRLGHDVVRGHDVAAQPDVLEGLEDVDDAGVVVVFRGDQREQKPGIDGGEFEP